MLLARGTLEKKERRREWGQKGSGGRETHPRVHTLNVWLQIWVFAVPLRREGIVYTLTHTPLLILPQNIPRIISTHTKETDSHHSHADQGAQPPAGRPQLAQGDALGVAAPRTESVPTHGQAEISTFHLPAHFVSQDPKEVGADEVGYAGRKEGHP